MLFAAEECYGGSGSTTHLWTVSAGAPVYMTPSINGAMEYDADTNMYYAYPVVYDAFYDGTGATCKRYYYFVNDGSLLEYAGVEITEEQLRMFPGASEILDTCAADGREVTDILYRPCGIININYIKGDANGNLTLTYDDYGVTDTGLDYGGYYLDANTPNIAVYPETFDAPLVIAEDPTAAPAAGGFSYAESGIGVCTITGYSGVGGAVVIPASIDGLTVSAIGDHAFMGNTGITILGIPPCVRSIGYNSFNGCTGLRSIMFTDGLESIGEMAFAGCTGLASIDLPASLLSIADYAFSDCTSLADVNIMSSQTAVGSMAFSGCGGVIINMPTPEPEPTAEPTVEPTAEPEPPETVSVPEIVINPTDEPVPTAHIEIVQPTYPAIDEIWDDITIGRSSVCYPCNYDVSEGCAIDGKLNTAWNSNGYAIGEWLSFTAPSGTITNLAGIRIISGYIKSDSVYYNNSRARILDVYCDGQYVESLTIADSKYCQTFWLSQPVSGNNFRFEVADAYYGTKYKDLGITEIELMGVNNEDFHTGDFKHWGRAVKRFVSKTKDGTAYQQGDSGYPVLGLQILLQRGFHVYDGVLDGNFGASTRNALVSLMDLMRASSASGSMEAMTDGVADAAFLNNLRIYIKTLN